MTKKCGFAVTPQLREKHWNWKGGRSSTGNGYYEILRPNHPNANKRGHVLEHRLVMEKTLGRYLTKSEKVHHINGDPSDNRPENLVVLSHRVHLRQHMCKAGENQTLLENKEWLSDQHTHGFNTNEIAATIGCGAQAVRHALHRFGIRVIVNENGHIPQKYPQVHNKAWLEEQTANFPQREIARMVGCTARLIHTMQKTFGIKSVHKPGPKS